MGATLRRAAKAGRKPGKMLAVLLRELRDADPRVSREAAEGLAQLEAITWQQHEQFYFTATVRSLEATAALAARRLGAGNTGAGRDAIGQLVALRSLVRDMQNGLGMMTPLEPGVTAAMRQGELAKLSQAIADSLNRASNNPDREVRRLARRATRVTPLFNPWLTCPPDVRTGLPRVPVRLHPKTIKEAAAA